MSPRDGPELLALHLDKQPVSLGEDLGDVIGFEGLISDGLLESRPNGLVPHQGPQFRHPPFLGLAMMEQEWSQV